MAGKKDGMDELFQLPPVKIDELHLIMVRFLLVPFRRLRGGEVISLIDD